MYILPKTKECLSQGPKRPLLQNVNFKDRTSVSQSLWEDITLTSIVADEQTQLA